jgi:hypothetical protein
MFAIARPTKPTSAGMIGTGTSRRPQQILGTTRWSIENRLRRIELQPVP